MHRLALLLALLSCASAVDAQRLPSLEEGRPFSTRFAWSDYGQNTQNWSIIQDPRGLIYAANSYGVLEYDGGSWRNHTFPDSSRQLVRSLAVTPSGNVYVGGVGTLGVLRTDSTHTLRFESLVPHIPAAHRDFADVWATHATAGGVVFQTPSALFRWDGRRMRVWEAQTTFHLSFLVDDVVYVREEGVGFHRLGAGGLERVPGGEAFADRRVFALLPHPDGLLAAVKDEGLVLLAEGQDRPLVGPASDFLAAHRPYAAVPVRTAYGRQGPLYAIATLGGGVLIADAQGEIVRVHREDVGLEEDDFVTGLAADAQGGLWLSLLDGIVRFDLFPRITEFSSGQGLPGDVYAVSRHRGTLYVGTSTGLFALERGGAGRPGTDQPYASFVPVRDRSGGEITQSWSFHGVGDDLLAATNQGVYVVRDGAAEPLTTEKAFVLHPAAGMADALYVGEKDGVSLLRREGGRWQLVGRMDGTGEIRSMADGPDGSLWAGRMDGGVSRAQRRPDGTYRVQTYGAEAGLPGGAITLSSSGRRLLAITMSGVYELAGTNPVRFERARGLGDLKGIYSVFEGRDEALWVYSDDVLRRTGPGAESLALRLPWVQVKSVFEESNGVVWIGTNTGILRYDPRVSIPRDPFPAFVRRVASVANGRRQTLYGGVHVEGLDAGVPVLTLPYGKNDLRFEFGAASYRLPHLTEFQYRISGGEWSPWAREVFTNETNLSEGTYTVEVRARGALGEPSEPASFVFRVLPPWYKTWWAYALYAVAFGGVVWGFSSWRLREQRRKLEAQRAAAARMGRLNDRLRETNERLRAADRLKDDLLANTSHELRTPLTAILGFSEMLLDEVADDQRDLAEGILRGGRRLLGTVNGLLDMYKLQSGTMALAVREVDAASAVRMTARLLEPIASERNLSLTVHPTGLALPAVVDPDVLDRLVTNVVGNALKFTEEGGVRVLVDGDDHALRIVVSDTGIGIAPEDLDRVFAPFEQGSTGFGRSYEGTGLGLSIVRQLLDLAGGTVDLESRVGEGTTVTLTLPRWADLPSSPCPPVRLGGNPSLGGAHVLTLGLDDETGNRVKGWLGQHGSVCLADTSGRAVREARRQAYDLVLVGADARDVEVKRSRLIRHVPGYAHVPVFRVGGAPLDTQELADRGFTHQLGLPLDIEALVELMEALLMHVEMATEV